MMKNKKPAIRFKGFSEEWEEKELGDVITFINGRAYSQHELLNRGKYKVLRVGNFYTNNSWYYSDMELGEKYYANSGDLLYTWSASFGPHIWQGEKVIYHYHIWKLALSEKLDTFFCVHHLDNDKEKILNDKNGSTMVHITKFGMEQKSVMIPQLEEQIPIGNFFKNLDNLITLHQRKYDKLDVLKKAMLEKMFPKNGANVPEIRFKGFSEAWEEKTLSCIVSRVACISNKVGLPRVEYEDIISGKGELNKDIEQKKSRKIGIEFEIGDILYGKLRPYLNNWLLPTFKGIAVGDFWVFRPNEVNSKFIFYLIQTSDYEKIANQSSGSKMPRADWSLISNAVFFIPLDKEEQQKIGTYFKNLDDLLRLHEKELEKLKNLKKALLEKMFV